MTTITFYSYKGGSCRSVTAFNVLPFLVEALGATAKEPILVVDMDLDSAGITALFGEEQYFQNGYDVKSLLEVGFPGANSKCADLGSHPFFEKVVPVGEKIGVENCAVLLLGANDNKILDNDEMGGDRPESIKTLKQACRSNNFKALILDSASGDQVPAKISTAAATMIVCCMRPTRQFRTYTFQYLSRLKDRISSGTKVILLPTAVPNRDVKYKNSTEKNNSLELIREKIDNFNDSELNCLVDEFVREDCFGIPEVEKFKWREDVLYRIKKDIENTKGDPKTQGAEILAEDEKLALTRYRQVAEVLKRLGEV
jgi:cellulose biosynthesis protein BcsQ